MVDIRIGVNIRDFNSDVMLTMKMFCYFVELVKVIGIHEGISKAPEAGKLSYHLKSPNRISSLCK